MPGGLGVRVDSEVYSGYRIPPFYDSMIAKLIVHGKTRNAALMRLRRALEEFVIDGVKTTIQEKVKLSAMLDKACNGGSIAHINIDAPFNDFDTAWNLLNYIADAGVVYFAFNLRISACKNNHGFYGDICPYCGEPVETTYQRIVGFLTPEKTYSKERKAEFRMRDWFDLNGYQEI